MVTQNCRPAVPVLNLYDRSLVYKKTHHLNHVIQRTTTIIAKIQDHCIYFLLLQLDELTGHIDRAAVPLRVVKIRIKFRKEDIADLAFLRIYNRTACEFFIL